MSRGTPKTLNQAIQNAFVDYKKYGHISEGRLRKELNLKLRDFLRNKIGPAYLIAGNDPEILKALDNFIKSLR